MNARHGQPAKGPTHLQPTHTAACHRVTKEGVSSVYESLVQVTVTVSPLTKTSTPTLTGTPTLTSTASGTATYTGLRTFSDTPTESATESATRTPTGSATATPTATATVRSVLKLVVVVDVSFQIISVFFGQIHICMEGGKGVKAGRQGGLHEGRRSPSCPWGGRCLVKETWRQQARNGLLPRGST